MLLEIDEVVVDGALWGRAKAGDREAGKEIAAALKGVELYMHAIHVKPTEVVVTLRELEGANVLDYITLGGQFTPGVVSFGGHEVHVRDSGER